jgi:tryptophan-rich sensory protein
MSAVKRWGGLGIAFACSFLVAGIGGSLTDLGPWYFALKQPAWKPPDIAFGPIWTTIFTLCALSGWGAWQLATSFKQKLAIALMFGVNGALNVLWSWLYFTLKRPDWALSELYVLWASVLLLTLGLWRISKLSSLMIVPYLVWVTTAGFLNHSTIELNGPFGP